MCPNGLIGTAQWTFTSIQKLLLGEGGGAEREMILGF